VPKEQGIKVPLALFEGLSLVSESGSSFRWMRVPFAPSKQARKESQALPLEDYDEMSVKDVKERVKDLPDKELQEIRDYEKRHKNRKTLVEALDRKL
jgi:hypothetical protein